MKRVTKQITGVPEVKDNYDTIFMKFQDMLSVLEIIDKCN